MIEINALSVDLLNPGTGNWSRVLSDVSLTLRAGEVLGLTGPSGGGKSTLGLLLSGLLPDSARVSVPGGQGSCQAADVPVRQESCPPVSTNLPHSFLSGRQWNRDWQRRYGRVLFLIAQDARSTLFPHRTIEWHLRRANQFNTATSTASRDPAQLLAELGFDDAPGVLRRLPGELSTGQCQRIQWAMTQWMSPRWLIADEPFASVDDELIRNLSRQMVAMKQQGRGILLISHQLAVLRALSDRVMVIERGRVRSEGLAETVIRLQQPVVSNASGGPAQACPSPAAEARAVVRITGLSKSYPPRRWSGAERTVIAFRNRDLMIRAGSRTGLTGKSGCGKTTLSRIIMGLLTASEGSIERLPDERPEWRNALPRRQCRSLWKRFQIVHQDTDLVFDPASRLGDALLQVVQAAEPELPVENAWQRAATGLTRFGLDPEMMLSPATRLSGGEKRRAAIVRSLLLLGDGRTDSEMNSSRPDRLLILDEPTVGLDHFWQDVLRRELLDVQQRLNLTYLVISHDRQFVRQFCDQIVEWQPA